VGILTKRRTFCSAAPRGHGAGARRHHRPELRGSLSSTRDAGLGKEYRRLGFSSNSLILTESQHGRGWKRPLWVTQPNRLPKQGHPEQAAQHRVQVGLEYLQRRRLHSLPGQPGPGLCHPQREEVLPHLQTELQ